MTGFCDAPSIYKVLYTYEICVSGFLARKTCGRGTRSDTR